MFHLLRQGATALLELDVADTVGKHAFLETRAPDCERFER